MQIDHNSADGVLLITMKLDLEAMLSKYGMSECKPESTPVVPGSKLVKPLESDPKAALLSYREAIGEHL